MSCEFFGTRPSTTVGLGVVLSSNTDASGTSNMMLDNGARFVDVDHREKGEFACLFI